MRFGELFELLITLFIFLVIWILPRIMAARAADRKRRKSSGAKSASRKAPDAAARIAPEPKRSWSKEIFAKLIDESFFDTEGKKRPAPVSVPDIQAERAAPEEPAEPVSVFEGEEQEPRDAESDGSALSEPEYQWDQQQRPLSELKPLHPKGVSSRNGRTSLQRAVIWKELLDPPKALRREPFP